MESTSMSTKLFWKSGSGHISQLLFVQNKLLGYHQRGKKKSKRERGIPKPVVGGIHVSIIALNEVIVKGVVHIHFSLSLFFLG